MTIEIAEHQRADAVRVAEANHLRLVHHDRREGSRDLRHGELYTLDERAGVLADECRDYLRIGGGLEGDARGLELLAQLGGVRQVAVVRERERATRAVADDRLGVLPAGRARRGVAGVADGRDALERLEGRLVEDLRDEAQLAHRGDASAVGDGNACALLPAMLQRVETEVGEPSDVAIRSINAEDAAHS